jgi:putative phosphonate catabolism associated alcohol dehydrogenase
VTSIRVSGDMYAMVFRGVDQHLESIAVPAIELHAGEALVAVELATVCGSDLHTMQGHRHVDTPVVLGHEQVGHIVAVGPGSAPRSVDGTALSVGQRVVWGVAVDCGACRYCLSGLPQKCVALRKYGHERVQRGWELNGGFASHVQLLARTPVVIVDEHIPAEVLAPASCATATVMAAIAAAEEVRPLAGAVVAVSGCGMLGLTAIAVAVARGAIVVASDPSEERRAAALAFGASAVSDGSDDGLRTALASVTEHGYGVALELSGAPAAVSALLGAADIGAALILVGSVFPNGTVAIDPEQVVRRLLTVRGVHNYAPQHLLSAVEFLRAADHDAFARLVDTVHPLDEIDRVLAAPGGGGVRIGLRPSGSAVNSHT